MGILKTAKTSFPGKLLHTAPGKNWLESLSYFGIDQRFRFLLRGVSCLLLGFFLFLVGVSSCPFSRSAGERKTHFGT